MLDLHGHQQWFSGLGEAGGDILLLGISLAEAHQFVDILYGRQSILNIGNRHFTVREDTEVTDEFVCNNNSDCEDVKLEPYEIYDQVEYKSCWKVFNLNWKTVILIYKNCGEFLPKNFKSYETLVAAFFKKKCFLWLENEVLSFKIFELFLILKEFDGLQPEVFHC